MSDTHDERGVDETPLARVRAFQRAANPNGDYHWPAEEAANVNGVPLYFDDIESLSAADNFDAVDAVVARWRKAEEQLAAATVRAEKAEALVAGFGPACCMCGRILGYRNYRNQLFCWPCADGEPKTTGAPPDGRSEPVERPETPGGHGEGSNSRAGTAGPSEACGNKCDYHVCFLPAGHDGDHRDSLNWTWMTHLGTWPNDDDTTEDSQHG